MPESTTEFYIAGKKSKNFVIMCVRRFPQEKKQHLHCKGISNAK